MCWGEGSGSGQNIRLCGRFHEICWQSQQPYPAQVSIIWDNARETAEGKDPVREDLEVYSRLRDNPTHLALRRQHVYPSSVSADILHYNIDLVRRVGRDIRKFNTPGDYSDSSGVTLHFDHL